MVERREADLEKDTVLAKTPRSLAISAEGVTTGSNFASLMSSVMADVIDGSLSTDVANAVCNAGGKLLKVVEMQYKYAGQGPGSPKTPPDLALTGTLEE
jgi:hypothetical protein